MNAAERIEGGIGALGGFFYQILGTVGLKAWAEFSDPEANELEGLIKAARHATAVPEAFGQDLALKPIAGSTITGMVLIQFKYSAQSPPPEIGPGDLRKIARRLAESIEQTIQGGDTVSAFYLVTNRALAASATGLISDAISGKQVDGLADPKYVAVLKDLKTLPGRHMADWYSALEKFGARYGLLREEIALGAHALVAKALAGTVASPMHAIDSSDLVACLSGNPNAKPIHRDDLQAVMESELQKLAAKL